MNAFDKNLAVARGEALAAHLIANAALQAMLMVLPNLPNRLEALKSISAFMDDTLNMSGPGPAKGDAHDDELNTLMRETARFQVTQTLQHIEHSLRNPPARG
jgi:hypothetical protein